MDVTCERCHTRYEFDDALVSSRGTTVKCTQCGNLFKVRASAGRGAADGWAVETQDGETLRFAAMRELQAAITSGRVSRDDLLVASTGPTRRLGAIEELESFFPSESDGEADTVRRRGLARTKLGVGAPPARPSASDRPSNTDRDGQPLPTRTGSTLRPPPSAVASGAGGEAFELERPTLRQAVDEVSPDSEPAGVIRNEPAAMIDAPTPEPTTRKRAAAVDGYGATVAAGGGEHESPPPSPRRAPEPAPSSSTTEAVEAMQLALTEALGDAPRGAARDEGPSDDNPRELPASAHISDLPPGISYPPPPGELERISAPPLTPSPSVGRPSILGRTSAFSDPRFSSFPPPAKQPSFARWIIGLVVLGVAGVVGFTLLKRYLPETESPAAAPVEDERVTKFLRSGRERLQAGDVEGAREQFVMASGVTDQDPRVARALADVEVIRADLAWLHTRLLPPDDPARARVRRDLKRAVQRAAEATKRAQQQAPRDRSVILLRISLLRLQGDREGARNLVRQLKSPGPEDAQVLAALDLTEAEPSWTSVIDRLQTAARAERKLGRARAMLVYALVMAGETDQATKELEPLQALDPPHSLADALQAFIEMDPSERATERDAGVDDEELDEIDEDGDGDIPTDFREAIRRAHAARRAGNHDRAASLYQAALDQNPGNSEALAGLAQVAQARGDSAGAIKAYESLLRQNPGYLPAMMGLADLKWQTGKRGEAIALYRQVVEASPSSSYASRAQQRIDSGTGSGSAATSPPPHRGADRHGHRRAGPPRQPSPAGHQRCAGRPAARRGHGGPA